jgi:hypothetical protein
MVIPILHGITADEAQLAISNGWSVLQKHDGRIKYQVYGTFPVGKIKKLTSYLENDENLSGQIEKHGS